MPSADEIAESTLRSERLLIEPLAAAHAEVLYRTLAEPELYRFIPQEPPASIAALRERFTRLEARHSPDGSERWLNWACRLAASGDGVGVVEITIKASGEVHLGYFIARDHWGRGYGREACSVVLAHLAQGLGPCRVIAEIDTGNVGSIALVRSLGFERVDFKPNADCFKGARSDEYVFAVNLSPPVPLS